MSSIERLVFEALATRLATLTWINKIEYQQPRLMMSDWRDHEIPAVQFWDNGEPYRQVREHYEADFGITIELVLKSTAALVQGQGDLFDRKQEIEDLIGSDPHLAINDGRIYQAVLIRSDTDIFTQQPFLIAQIGLNVLLNKRFSGC